MTFTRPVDTTEFDLTARVARLEQSKWRMKLRDADVVRLQPGDFVVMKVTRPISSDERQALVNAWENLMQQVGHQGLPLVVLAGAEIDLSVMRFEDAVSG